jgi:hypothetical protein
MKAVDKPVPAAVMTRKGLDSIGGFSVYFYIRVELLESSFL